MQAASLSRAGRAEPEWHLADRAAVIEQPFEVRSVFPLASFSHGAWRVHDRDKYGSGVQGCTGSKREKDVESEGGSMDAHNFSEVHCS